MLQKWAVAAGICICLSAAAEQESIATFGTTVVIPAGLRGDIYYVPRDTVKLPIFEWLKPVGSIYTTSLNVPRQNFRQGFPGVTERFEWFAIDYNGRFWIEKAGVYQFRLTSDDGAKLYIDDELIVDNDGIHPSEVKTGRFRLTGGIHRMRVSYLQGPGDEIALILEVAGPGEGWRIFSTDEFKPPPDPETWAYPGADHTDEWAVSGSKLRVSSTAGAPGDEISVEVSVELSSGSELSTLQWEMVVPAQLLELIGNGAETGRAAAESGRLVGCSTQKNYLYVCELAGGQRPIINGPIAVFHFKIRPDAQSRTTAFRIEKAEALSMDRRPSVLNATGGSITIH